MFNIILKQFLKKKKNYNFFNSDSRSNCKMFEYFFLNNFLFSDFMLIFVAATS